jgi:hypothetical protein
MENSKILGLLVALLGTLAMIQESGAQSLPDHHYRSADIVPSGDFAARGLFSKSPAKFIRYTVGLDNTKNKSVIVLWEGAYMTNGVMDYNLRDLKWRVYSTSFRPLAVASEGGIGSVLYVIGWYDRTGEVTVERWTMGYGALTQTIGPTGNPIVGLAPPPISKVEIYRGTAMGPAYDAVFHPFTRELLLLADDSDSPSFVKGFYALDVDAQQPAPVLRTDLNIGLLPQARGLKLGVTYDEDVYVFVFDVLKWGTQIVPTAHQSHVLGDVDGDGAFEITFQDDAAAVGGFANTLTWDFTYAAISGP